MSEVFEKHSRMPRKFLTDGTEKPQDELTGQFLEIPQERKQACLDDVKPMLMAGATLAQIAEKHAVGLSTINFWLAQMPEEYREIRKQWLDSKLASSEAKMQDASDPFQLAKGRELARMAMWYAERRDPERYADKRELTVKQDEPQTPEAIRERIQMLEGKLGVRVIEGEKQAA